MPVSSLLDRLRRPGTVLLDTARPDADNKQTLLFCGPVRQLRAGRPEEVESLLHAIDSAVNEGFYVAGFLAYESATTLLKVDLDCSDGLLGWFGVYEAPVVLAPDEVDQIFADAGEEGCITGSPAFDFTRDAYSGKLAVVQHHIREGDVYQINFTGRCRFSYSGSPLGVYRSIRDRQRVPYGAYIDTGECQVLSFSPELFFRREGDLLTTQPMKGTVRRGETPAEDDRFAGWLASDEKSRAENLMIVDLLRNDLSVCCRNGSVRVPALFATHRYETLIQMTSTVEGHLKPGTGYAGILQALFPCGSVTGAPKIRAMQIIRALEEDPRGVYCGAIGYAAPDERAVFSVAIRTLILQDGAGTMGVGSGVVADSDTNAEYDECLLKAQFLTDSSRPEPESPSFDFQLIETMRWEEGGIPLLELHLARLASSARRFDMPYRDLDVRSILERETASLVDPAARRVRLTLSASGELRVTVSDATVPASRPLRVKISRQRVDSTDAFVYHKTTRRTLYDEEYRQAVSEGFDEVLFLNERREVAEGSRTNIFVQKAGTLLTPPVSSGLLPGVYRRHLLDTRPGAEERILSLEDLYGATKCYVCNAVWGLVEIILQPASE